MDALASTLWREFAIETEEHLQTVEPILLRAEPQQTGKDDIAQLFRSFHSIKGLARAMDVLGMEGVAHHAENLLGLVRDGRTGLTVSLADLLLQSADALKRMRDAVAAHRDDVPAAPELIARLAAEFAELGGLGENDPPPPVVPPAAAAGAPLHDDPEMLAIFVEMIETLGSGLCAGLADGGAERAPAVEAARTLTHAAEVMNFDALSASFGELRDVLQKQEGAGRLDAPTRREVLGRLGDIRLQIELVGELTGRDAGTAAFSAALARHVGDERYRIAVALNALNRRLRDDLAEGDPLAVEADAAAMSGLARTLHAVMAALSLRRAAEIVVLIEDLTARIASGEVAATEPLVEAAGAIIAQLVAHAETGGTDDLTAAAAAQLTARLRALTASTAQKMIEDGGGLVAGLHLPLELLTILSDENLAQLETGIGTDRLLPYEMLVHLEADRDIARRWMAWLTGEARAITNRTVLVDGESWFEFLVLSALEPDALADKLLALDPGRRCVKRVRRLTDRAGGVLALAQPAGRPVGDDISMPPSPVVPGNLIRVRGELVDSLLDDIGELRVRAATLRHVIRGAGSRAMLARVQHFSDRLPNELRREFLATFRDFRERDRGLLESEELIAGMLRRLHQSALELRVVPVDVVFNRLPRMVRDLARQQGKSIEFALEGRDVRIDKSMVDILADPLIHMIRNAIDHGIEPSEERLAAGKPERAHLNLRAAQHGSVIDIEIADDGRGLDAEAIRGKAVARGLVSPAQAAALSDAEIFDFIFAAGLSTASAITETSGRGVGMEIVLATVRRLNGDIKIRSERGRGTNFTLVLPLSAALQTALIVRVGDQSLAIPERHVVAVAEIDVDAIRLVGSHRSILHRQAVLPLYGLGQVLGMPNGGVATGSPPRMDPMDSAEPTEPIVVITNGRQMIGLEVDAIERIQELFLKDLDPRLAGFPAVGGASMLGDGRVVLVLDGEELIQLAARGIEPPPLATETTPMVP